VLERLGEEREIEIFCFSLDGGLLRREMRQGLMLVIKRTDFSLHYLVCISIINS
jgi:hypothetical protein